MNHPIRSRRLFSILALIAALLAPLMAKADEKNQLRIVCASILTEKQELILAARDDKGEWKELSTFIPTMLQLTDWLPAQTGELHLTIREEGTLKSIGQLTYPEDAKRALAVLHADLKQKTYTSRVIDPEKSHFDKGTILAINFSEKTATISLGAGEEKIEANQHAILKPTLEEKSMYRLLISYPDAEGNAMPYYDRQVSANATSRDLLILLPDAELTLKVLSLPLFGALD